MRSIKFRFWDVEHKRWLIKGELEDVGHYEYGSIVPNTLVLQDQRNENILTSQFTGLLDKNGKEIYEGDILLYNAPKSKKKGRTTDEKHYWEVYFSPRGNWKSRHRGIESSLFYQTENYEVCGNIYENPELLKP